MTRFMLISLAACAALTAGPTLASAETMVRIRNDSELPANITVDNKSRDVRPRKAASFPTSGVGVLKVGFANGDMNRADFNAPAETLPVENLRSAFAVPLHPDAFNTQAARRLQITFELRSAHPDLTAVFAYNDLVAIGAHRAARRLGVAVPQDCALLGFDGLSIGELIDPPLTTLRIDKRLMGQLAIDQVDGLLLGTPVERALLPAELVIRGTT